MAASVIRAPGLERLPTGVDVAGSGLWAGEVVEPPETARPRRGRLRRWFYTAIAGTDDEVGAWTIGAAIVVIGPAGRKVRVAATPAGNTCHRGRMALMWEDGLDLKLDGWELTGDVTPDVAAVCATSTPRGGWNVTQKGAGETASVELRTPAGRRIDTTTATSWRDWTAGRQDRHTRWTWAAGGGQARDTRLGWNVSTGMNEAVGEDVVWLDGTPHHVPDVAFGPVSDDPGGTWRLDSSGLRMRLSPHGVRAAREQLVVASSTYVQPYGRWQGSLVTVDGEVPFVGHGVAEDHEVRW